MSYDVVLPGHTRTYIDIAHSHCTYVLKKDAVLHSSTTGTMLGTRWVWVQDELGQ